MFNMEEFRALVNINGLSDLGRMLKLPLHVLTLLPVAPIAIYLLIFATMFSFGGFEFDPVAA